MGNWKSSVIRVSYPDPSVLWPFHSTLCDFFDIVVAKRGHGPAFTMLPQPRSWHEESRNAPLALGACALQRHKRRPGFPSTGWNIGVIWKQSLCSSGLGKYSWHCAHSWSNLFETSNGPSPMWTVWLWKRAVVPYTTDIIPLTNLQKLSWSQSVSVPPNV